MKLIVILGLCLCPVFLFPCSILSVKNSDSVFMAGNEDWYPNNSGNSIKVVPPSEEQFGYILMGVTWYLERYPQIGMNDQGLCVDWATVVPGVAFVEDSDKTTLFSPLLPLLMAECSTVEDVLGFIGRWNIPNLAQEHLFVTDKTGSSVVIEWGSEGIEVIPSNGQYLVATNFPLLDPPPANALCSRFSYASDFLENHDPNDISEKEISEVLEHIKLDQEFVTMYSYLFNLKTGQLTLYNDQDYSRSAVFNLDQLLAEGAGIVSLEDLEYRR